MCTQGNKTLNTPLELVLTRITSDTSDKFVFCNTTDEIKCSGRLKVADNRWTCVKTPKSVISRKRFVQHSWKLETFPGKIWKTEKSSFLWRDQNILRTMLRYQFGWCFNNHHNMTVSRRNGEVGVTAGDVFNGLFGNTTKHKLLGITR